MRKLMVVGLLILPLLVVGCNKAPAEAALKAADEAIAQVKPAAEMYVPDQFKTLESAAAHAKALFDKGDYAAALAAAKDLPAKATEVANAATAKKDEIVKTWTEFQGSLPALVQGLTDKVGVLAKMKKLPKGIDAAQLATAKTSLAGITDLWTAATAAFGGGDLKGAVAKAGDVKVKVGELTTMLEAVTLPPAKK
jgi:hypothetical protein